mmetsp:Transcript_11336/g.28649  ORF Transcript_11336/g.28649 Transcript_11336/m.28649 type:complete len:957 (-) Transcript_11336:15-2885(-)
MGNIPLSSSDLDSACGRITEQIDGILAVKKQPSPTKNAKQRLRELWNSTSPLKKSKRVKSLLMRSILERDWQKVLIRARLFPREIHEFTVLEVPLSWTKEVGSNRRSTKQAGLVSYCRVKVLPIHAACASRPPPEIVRALLSHAVSSAFSSNDGMTKGAPKKAFGKRRDRFQHLSGPTPLHHEHNVSFAAVTVERVEESSIGKVFVKKLCQIGDVARKASYREKRSNKLRLSCSMTKEEDLGSNFESAEDDCKVLGPRLDSRDSPKHCKNKEDVTVFLKQIEDHLAHNGRCRGVFRDINHGSTESSQHHRKQSRFVLDINPSQFLPSPSAVRVNEKQNEAIGRNKREDDLFSLEVSVGDSDTAMTTSTNRLVGNYDKGDEDSTNLEYLMDESSSTSSSLMEPPNSDFDDSSNDSNIFLQLAADGKLTFVDLEDYSSSSENSYTSNNQQFNRNDGGNISATTAVTGCQPSNMPSSDSNFSSSRRTFVPEDIQLDHSALFESLAQSLNRKEEGDHAAKSLSQKHDHVTHRASQLLPLHIACLYGASAAILKILLEEYPEGSSIEVLGMLPVHMVSAKWSLVNESLGKDGRCDCDGSYSVEGFDSEKNRIAALVECSPGSLCSNSSAHGLRPLEYVRILLCYPSNVSDEGMVRVKNYLDSQEDKRNMRFDARVSMKDVPENEDYTKNDLKESNSREKDHDIYCNDIIPSTSTCTTSGLSSAWLANDSSSVFSSLTSTPPTASHLSLGGLLSQNRWKEAMCLVETNPDTAKERCFSSSAGNLVSGNDISFSSASSAGLKEQLPVHVLCQILKSGISVPIDLVELVVSSYPEGLMETDDESISGSLPLHMICDSFRRNRHTYLVDSREEDYRVFVSERLQALQIMLSAHPDATHVVDNRGRLPLHRAVLVGAPLEAIQLLVYRFPKAISLADQEAMTPFHHAKKAYAFGSPVIGLLKQAWI